ncbi:MAG: glycosyltransferase family 39 protein [Deltaproteobacteria bacterium]|nr:glycosyltransferase family 39 protein [Deltaproteobacteria bacterium]
MQEAKEPCAGKTLLVIFLLALALLALAGQSSLWDRDEPLFARTACEMLQSGDWRLPAVNGGVRPQKPPLAFWAMAGSMALFGINALAARLPAVISLAATGWLVFLMGRLLFSPMVGFWACVMLMSSAMSMFLGSAAMVDGPLLAFISLAMYAHLKGLHQPKRWYVYWPVLATALGCAELTKHPVGMATAAPAMLCSTWLLRKDMKIPRTYWLGLFLAFLVGYGFHQAWYIPVRNMAPGFGEEMYGRQIFDRIFTAMEGHGVESLLGYLLLLPFYAPILLVGFAPWSTFLPAGISAFVHRHIGSRPARIFVISWILPILALFTLAVTKLPHYIFPIFPPVALIVAGLLEAWRKGQLNQKDRYWLRFGAWLYAPLVSGFGAALCVASVLMGEGIWRFVGVLPGLLIVPSCIYGFRLIRAEKLQKAAWSFLMGTPLLLLTAAMLTLPAIEPIIKISPVLAETIRAKRSTDEPVAMCGYMEPSFIFYMDLPATQSIAALKPDPEALHAWAIGPGAGWLVVYDSLWKKMIDRFGPAERVRSLMIVPVLNPNDRAREDHVRVVHRLPRLNSPINRPL